MHISAPHYASRERWLYRLDVVPGSVYIAQIDDNYFGGRLQEEIKSAGFDGGSAGNSYGDVEAATPINRISQTMSSVRENIGNIGSSAVGSTTMKVTQDYTPITAKNNPEAQRGATQPVIPADNYQSGTTGPKELDDSHF